MLTEDDVIDHVRDFLLLRGWEQVRRATAIQRGDDLVMQKGPDTLVIEAKGAGSSKPTSARFGKEFNRGQVFDHVGKAVLKALRVASSRSGKAGIALPDNDNHRREVGQILPALERIGVVVFWVSDSGEVRTEGEDAWLR